MENMTNNIVENTMETVEEVVTKNSGVGRKVAAGAGLITIVSGIVYGGVKLYQHITGGKKESKKIVHSEEVYKDENENWIDIPDEAEVDEN